MQKPGARQLALVAELAREQYSNMVYTYLHFANEKARLNPPFPRIPTPFIQEEDDDYQYDI